MTADAYDAPLSAVREHVEDLAHWLAIWTHRTEPDAFARRCANDTVHAIDAEPPVRGSPAVTVAGVPAGAVTAEVIT